MATFASHLPPGGLHSARPSASSVPAGTLYYETDTKKIFQSDGSSAWSTWADLSALGGAMSSDTLWDTKGDLAVATGADAASKLAVGSNGQVLTADSTQTTGIKWGAAGGGLTPVFDVVVARGNSGDPATGATVIDSNTILGGNIPQTGAHLMLKMSSRDTHLTAKALVVTLRLNNDSGSVYSYQIADSFATASNPSESLATTSYRVGVQPGGGSPSHSFSGIEANIFDYTDATHDKAITSHSSSREDTVTQTMRLETCSGVWFTATPAAVTRIQLLPNTAFADHTRVTLYIV